MYKNITWCLIVFMAWSAMSMQQQHDSGALNQLTETMKNLAIGAGTGMSEVVTGRPLDYVKTMLMTKKTISSNPANWYRGASIHIIAVVPTTIIQTQLEQGLHAVLPEAYTAPAAGAVSGFCANPVERIILEQQQTGTKKMTAKAAIAQIYREHGAKSFYTGLPMVSMRELIFASGYMKIIPALKRTIGTYTDNPLICKSAAAIIGGTALSLMSHPAESIRVRQQNGSGSIVQTICVMHNDSTGLVKNLWAGAAPRAMRYSLALLIMSETREWLTKQMKNTKPA